jgi:hypothetical protein
MLLLRGSGARNRSCWQGWTIGVGSGGLLSRLLTSRHLVVVVASDVAWPAKKWQSQAIK